MTFETGTQSEVLFAGPPAAYTAGGSSSTSAFALTAGSTGNYQQPVFCGGLLLQPGRNNQLITVEGWLAVSAEGSATTAVTVTVALQTSANQSTTSAEARRASHVPRVDSHVVFFRRHLVQDFHD